jgi:hypothetical protein
VKDAYWMEESTWKYKTDNVKSYHRFVRTVIDGGSNSFYAEHLLNTAACSEKIREGWRTWLESEQTHWHRTVCVLTSLKEVTLGQVFKYYSSFPCQYHSTNAPYSFIHLPLTLYNVFLPVHQFPLSVSFHQFSILVRACVTAGIFLAIDDVLN